MEDIEDNKNRIKSITLVRNPDENSESTIIKDCDIALNDLKYNSYFQPISDNYGPYSLELYIEDNKLIFHIQTNKQEDLPYLVLSLKPYSRIIKDYFIIMQSYRDALNDGKPSRIEAIDMGRRGLHNEGAELLLERLSSKIKLNISTARRLFTLICTLHSGKTHMLR